MTVKSQMERTHDEINRETEKEYQFEKIIHAGDESMKNANEVASRMTNSSFRDRAASGATESAAAAERLRKTGK